MGLPESVAHSPEEVQMNLKLLAGVVLALSIPTVACSGDAPLQRTQLPPPFGAPRPIIPGQQCLPETQKILKLQKDAFKALQRLSRRDGETLCASLESADQLGVQKFLDPKAIEPLLTPQQRELLGAFGIDLSKVDVAKIMRLLGVDLSQIDLAKLKQQCRESQGELDRFATRELNRVEEELFRCDDRV
jgi:hypothetical protein